MLCHNNLFVYYQTIFNMAQHHKYSISELEAMLPFERDIYATLLAEHLRKLEEQQQRDLGGMI
jgi:hypothetical protein